MSIESELEAFAKTPSDDDVTTVRIALIGDEYEEHAAQVLEILKGRKSDVATQWIGAIGENHKEHAAAALDILKGRDGDLATQWIGLIGLEHEEYAAVALEILKGRKGDEATAWIGTIGHEYEERAVEAQDILLNRAENGMGSSQAVFHNLEGLMPELQALERILTCGDRLSGEGRDLQSEDYQALREVAWRLSKKISEPAFLVEKLQGRRRIGEYEALENLMLRAERSSLLPPDFKKKKPLSAIFRQVYNNPTPLEPVEVLHAAAFPEVDAAPYV